MSKYSKAIVAVVGVGATLFFDAYGQQIGLPADWPETVTAMLTPVAVWLFPNA